MALIASQRWVNLIDNRVADKPFIRASVTRNYFARELIAIEASWAAAREAAFERGNAAGLTPLEHSHWDWRIKADSVDAGRHSLVLQRLFGCDACHN